MNVIFHITTAVSVAVLLTDTKIIEQSNTYKNTLLISFFAFVTGLISHGVLDYIPHCYPLNSKFDSIVSLTMILTTIRLTNKKYRLIMGLSFLGCVLPDLVDLLPAIINKQIGLNLPTIDKIFPWHLRKYSGSIYNNDCNNSTLNHVLLIFTLIVICWCRTTYFKIMFISRV